MQNFLLYKWPHLLSANMVSLDAYDEIEFFELR